MEPAISVIIPVYKVEQYIRKCLDSVVNQTWRDLEIIIVDDGSPDRCGAVCDEYADRDSRIRVIHKKNAGVGAARNDGIAAANGEWVAFLDPDDWIEPDYFARLVSAIPEGHVDVLCSNGHISESRQGSVICRMFDSERLGKYIDRQLLIQEALAPGFCFSGTGHSSVNYSWNKLYLRSFLVGNHLRFDLLLHPFEDVLFHLEIFEKTNTVFACDYIGYHYKNDVETSSQHRFNAGWPVMRERFADKVQKYVDRQPDGNVYQDALNIRMLKLILTNLRLYFCHPDNPMPYSKKAAEFRRMRKQPWFQSAVRGKSLAYLRRNERIKIRLVRLPFFGPVYFSQCLYDRLFQGR